MQSGQPHPATMHTPASSGQAALEVGLNLALAHEALGSVSGTSGKKEREEKEDENQVTIKPEATLVPISQST